MKHVSGRYNPTYLRNLKQDPAKVLVKDDAAWSSYKAINEIAANGSMPKDYFRILIYVLEHESMFSFSFVRHPETPCCPGPTQVAE